MADAEKVVGEFNLFDNFVGDGEVDKRKNEFMKKFFGTEGAGVIELGKKKFIVTFGEAQLPFEAKQGWTQRRIMAMDRAELAARAQMVEMIESKIENEQLFEEFQDYGDAVKKNIAFIQDAKKKGALSAQKYKEAIGSFAVSQVIGAVTIKTLEGMNGDQYKCVRIVIWSPTLRDLAINSLLDSDYLLPIEKVADADLDQIPQKEAELVREIGCKVYFNKKGQRYYVSYGQAEAIAQQGRNSDCNGCRQRSGRIGCQVVSGKNPRGGSHFRETDGHDERDIHHREGRQDRSGWELLRTDGDNG